MRATRFIILAALAAAVLAAWLLLRPAPVTAPAPADAAAALRATPGAGPARPAPAPDASTAATPGGATEGQSDGGDPAVTPAAPLAPVDQRQNAKIARGLAANPSGGLLVGDAEPGTIAGQLRLKVGDTIVSVNGQDVTSTDDFVRIYREQGTPTELTIRRGGREMHLH